MRNWLIGFSVLALVAVGFMMTGCEEVAETVSNDVTANSPRSVAIGQTNVSPTQALSITFQYPIKTSGITKDNLFTHYLTFGANHSAGTPTVSSLSWSTDAKTMTIGISGWSNVAAAGITVLALPNPQVQIEARFQAIEDVFGNFVGAGATLWEYTMSGSVSSTTTSTTVSTTSTSGSSTSTSTTTTTTVAQHALVGTWVGSWTDTRYNATGTLEGTITQSGANIDGSGNIDLSDPIVGLTANNPGTATGTISGNNVTFTFTSATVGNGQGTITGNLITGTGEVGAPLSFGTFTMTGTIDASGNYVYGSFDFDSPTGGWGTAEVYRQ